MLLGFALVLKAHSALVHVVGINTKLAAKALGIICRRPEQRRGGKSKVKTGRGGAELTHRTQSLSPPNVLSLHATALSTYKLISPPSTVYLRYHGNMFFCQSVNLTYNTQTKSTWWYQQSILSIIQSCISVISRRERISKIEETR